MKRILPVVMILLLCATLLFGCNRTPAPEEFGMQLSAPKEGDTIAVFVTDLGTFKAVLFPEQAPLAVDNFVQLAESGYYNGLIYHRVVPDFVIQTGDPTGSGSGGESASGSYFNNEYSPVLHHFNGALGMANSAENMNASQFYVVSSSPVSENLVHQMELKGAQEGYDDTVINAYKTIGGRPTLDYLYTVFGQVYEGRDTVEKINGVPTDENDRPLDDVKLLSVLIETYTA